MSRTTLSSEATPQTDEMHCIVANRHDGQALLHCAFDEKPFGQKIHLQLWNRLIGQALYKFVPDGSVF